MNRSYDWTPGWIRPLAVSAALLVAGCGADAGPDRVGHLEVQAVSETVVTTESGLIGGLADWAVHDDGSLFVLDFQGRTVHVIDPGGRPHRTLGGPGQGPGELERPASLHLEGESLVVVDPGNGRLQRFTLEGEPAPSRTIPACASGPAPPVPGPDGVLVRPTLGFDEGLAVVCAQSGEERARLGDLLAPGQAVVDMGQMRAQIREGEVPGMLLNAAGAVVGEDGAVWLMVSAAKQIERYGPLGDRIFRIVVEEPEFEEVRGAWIERNNELEVPAISSLNYFRSAREVLGNLWILTNTAAQPGTKLVVVSDEGEVKRRLEFAHVTGATDFAVDEERGWVYFYISDTAEVVRVEFDPSEAVG